MMNDHFDKELDFFSIGVIDAHTYISERLKNAVEANGLMGWVFTPTTKDVYKRQLERTVLTRQMKDNITHDTYYVYDDYGNLCFVLQPMYQESTNLSLYAFQYKYDSRNRCIEKKLPGADAIKYVYDQMCIRDR